MKSNLTLTLDKDAIKKAKEYAAAQERILSNLVESYLKAFVNREELINLEKFPISPLMKSMTSGNHLPTDFDYKTAIGTTQKHYPLSSTASKRNRNRYLHFLLCCKFRLVRCQTTGDDIIKPTVWQESYQSRKHERIIPNSVSCFGSFDG